MLSNRGIKNVANLDQKWRFAPGGDNRYDSVTNPSGVISFATAENNLVQDELQQFVNKNVTIPTEAFAYRFSTAGGPRFPIAMANHLNEYFHPHIPIQAYQIATASGLTSIHTLLAHNLGDPGDGVLVSRPIYGRFELDFGNTANLEIVYADMNDIDPFEEPVVDNYEKALEKSVRNGIVIRALLIVNPHNPLGRCYPVSTLRKIMAFCERNQIHLISDEVYALSVYDTKFKDAPKFTSVLSIDPQGLINTERVHVLYGMSKDFAAAGLRLGSLITNNLTLKKSIMADMRFHNPSGISIAIGTAILENRDFVASFITLSRERLSACHAYTTGRLDKAGIIYHQESNAGLFLYVDLSPWLNEKEEEPEFELAQRLLDAGVGVHPCEEHDERKGWFRLVFSLQRDVLEVGLDRLIQSLSVTRTT